MLKGRRTSYPGSKRLFLLVPSKCSWLVTREVDGMISSLVWNGGLDCFFLLFLMEVATIVEGVKVSILEYSGLVVKMGVVKIVFLGCRLKICGVWL